MVCTFFGHRVTPREVEPRLRETVVDLIEHHGVHLFYVGNQGGFDGMVQRVLKELSAEYPQITYYIVLAYLPGERRAFDPIDYSKTLYPEGLERVPKRFAISHRNRWLIAQSDVVITYVEYAGGAAQYKALAEKKGKWVINLFHLGTNGA